MTEEEAKKRFDELESFNKLIGALIVSEAQRSSDRERVITGTLVILGLMQILQWVAYGVSIGTFG